MEQKILQLKLLEFQPKTSFCIISKGLVVNIRFDEITHVSKYGNETVIYTKVNNYRTYLSLRELLNDLPVNDFFRVHKSHVISLRHMNGFRKKRVDINGDYLPISYYYKTQLCTQLQQIINKNLNFYTFLKTKSSIS